MPSGGFRKGISSMTQEQYEHWKDFAARMGKTVYCAATSERQKKIQEELADYFWWRDYQNDWPSYTDWDGNGDECCLCDDVDDFFDKYSHWSRREERYTGRLYEQITSCIRAGFDVAVKQSGGVLGFSVGDVRRMFGGEAPAWITSDNFANKPDDTPIWL